MTTWIASWYFTGTVVPLYDTLGDEGIEWIVKQTELKTLVTTSPSVGKIAKLKHEGRLETLKVVVSIEEPTREERELLAKTDLKVYLYRELVEQGDKFDVILKPEITPNTLAVICHTSGTTSRPKGVMLTHRNYTSMVAGATTIDIFESKRDEIYMSWLPLAHVMEQDIIAVCLCMGIQIGFYAGDTMKLLDDLQELKPHYFGSVPRVFNRIYEGTLKEVAKLRGFKRYFYEKGVAAKLERLRSTGCNTHAFYDRFAFSKIRNVLGGRTKLIFLGGAPLSPEIQEMSRVWMGCSLTQGYGQTETTGSAISQSDNDTYPASIGAPENQMEAKLVDIPEMKYFATDMTNGTPTPRGEIMLRGPAVAAGYWKEPELTRETFGADGWLRTGDVGFLAPCGQFVIVDRKKHIFKLAQGEYIAPECLENIYVKSRFVSQLFVTGDSYNTFIIGVVVPRADTAAAWAKEKGIEGTKYEAVCANDEFKLDILRDLEQIGRAAKVRFLDSRRDCRETDSKSLRT